MGSSGPSSGAPIKRSQQQLVQQAREVLSKESKRPYIEYFPMGPPSQEASAAEGGLAAPGGRIDYFPHMASDTNDPYIDALKAGTYQPFGRTVPYTVEVFADAEIDTGICLQASAAGAELGDARLGVHHGPLLHDLSVVRTAAGRGSKFYDYTRSLTEMYTRKQNRFPLQRRYYANPRQYYDNILLADAHTNSFAGLVLDTKVDYVFPRRLHPVLKLRAPSGDDAEDAKLIEKHSYLIDKLEAIDDWYSGLGPYAPGTMGMSPVPVQDKLKTAYRLSQVFGRSIIAKESWPGIDPVTIFPRNKTNGKRTKSTNGKYKSAEEIKGIPPVLKVIHPMYAGLTELDLLTGDVSGVWLNDNQSYLPAEQMVYMLNGFQTPQPGSEGYGESAIQRALDHVRLYRRLLAVNFPQFLRTSASGMGVFVVNTTGYPSDERERIRTNLRESYAAAELGVLDIGNVDEFKFEEFKINTDIDALVKMEQSLLGSISTVMNMPHSILMDTNESKATLIGRVLTFLEINVVSWRAQLGRQVAQQYYMPNFRALCENLEKDKALLEQFYIDVRFEEVSLETRQEKVDRLILESQLNPYKDSWIGEQLGDPDYEQHIDPEKIEEQKRQEQMELSIQMNRAKGSGAKGDGPGGNPVKRGRSKNGKMNDTKSSGPPRRTGVSGR